MVRGEVCGISESHLLKRKGGTRVSHRTQSLMLLLSDVFFSPQTNDLCKSLKQQN